MMQADSTLPAQAAIVERQCPCTSLRSLAQAVIGPECQPATSACLIHIQMWIFARLFGGVFSGSLLLWTLLFPRSLEQGERHTTRGWDCWGVIGILQPPDGPETEGVAVATCI